MRLVVNHAVQWKLIDRPFSRFENLMYIPPDIKVSEDKFRTDVIKGTTKFVNKTV